MKGVTYMEHPPVNERPHPFWDCEQPRALQKNITHTANSMGVMLLLVRIVGRLVLWLLPVLLLYLVPNASQSGPYYTALRYVLYAPIGLLTAAYVGAKMTKSPLSQVIPFDKVGFAEGLGCVLFCYWGILIGSNLNAIVSMFLPRIQETYNATLEPVAASPLGLVISLLQTAVVPALVEEFVFRGVMLGILRRYGDWFAIITSAFLFGVIHGNFVQMPFAFFAGLFFAYTVVRTGSLVPAIAIHFLNNASSVLMRYFDASLVSWLGQNYSLYVMTIWFVLGLIGLLILLSLPLNKMFGCIRPYKACLSPAKRTLTFLKSPVLWLAIAYYAYQAVSLWQGR